jgi:hypothetical protein
MLWFADCLEQFIYMCLRCFFHVSKYFSPPNNKILKCNKKIQFFFSSLLTLESKCGNVRDVLFLAAFFVIVSVSIFIFFCFLKETSFAFALNFFTYTQISFCFVRCLFHYIASLKQSWLIYLLSFTSLFSLLLSTTR